MGFADASPSPSSTPSSTRSSSAAGRPSPGSSLVPDVPPLSDSQLDELVDFVQTSSGVLVLTGAGCSTESHIPDYRGPAGAYS